MNISRPPYMKFDEWMQRISMVLAVICLGSFCAIMLLGMLGFMLNRFWEMCQP